MKELLSNVIVVQAIVYLVIAFVWGFMFGAVWEASRKDKGNGPG